LKESSPMNTIAAAAEKFLATEPHWTWDPSLDEV
jgi:hypothetical protein